MANYQEMTKAELIAALRGLEAQLAPLGSVGGGRDRPSQELSVNPVELEAQNQELREAQRVAEESRDHCADQYDFAPTGYVTLDADGHIQDINLTGAKMLGVERSRLIGVPFSRYVTRTDAGVFRSYLRQSRQSQEPVTAELQVAVKGGQGIQVQLVSLALRDSGGGVSCYRITMTDVTTFREAEQEKRTSARLLAKIFASLDHALFVADSSTHVVVSCNAAAVAVFGYALHEMIGKTTEVLHVDQTAYETFLQRLSLALERLGVYHTLVAMRRKDGNIFPAEITVTEIRSDAGSRTGVVILVHDVSERKQAEQAPRENEDRFRAIFEQAAVGVSQCVSKTGEYARINRKYCDIAGYAREELLTRRFQDITHPDDLAAELKLMQQLMRGEIRTFSMEKRICRKDGGNVWVNLTVSPMWASGEEPSHHIAIIEDITERRHAVEDTRLRLAELEPVSEISTALRAARTLGEMLPMLLDLTLGALHATQGSIWLYDSVEDVLRPAASRGGSEEEGTSPRPLKPGEGIVGAVFATGQPHLVGDFRLGQGAPKATRRRIPPDVGGAAVPIRAGDRVIGTFVINVSLPRRLTLSEIHLLTSLSELAGTASQRIMLREEAEHRAAELEQRVIERTAELSQREAALEAANAKLKELDRMKSQFVSNVSHELRTPITTIILYASLLRKGPPERRDQFLVALEQEANRQAHLIEEILQVSRIESGRLDLQCALHDLSELAQASVTSREQLAAEKGVTLVCQSLTPGLTVSVDRARTLQVIGNLVENALWYTQTGGRVSVATGTAEVDEQIRATLSVTDTGMGIPKDELPRIFERFFRGEKPREMQLPGTGLGLAIVKDIVDLHGWQVTVDSQVGGGSTFTIWLPLA
jgi:PAS domain S-box-containing protein